MLLCCAGAPFLIMLDTNIVAVSLPSIARDLKGSFTDVEWVVSAYILPFAALLMPAGIVLFGAGLFSVVWALIDANSVGWESPRTILRLVVGAILLVAFVFAERRHPRPMIDLSIFRDPTVVGAAVAMLGYAAAAQVMMTILPLHLQDAFVLRRRSPALP